MPFKHGNVTFTMLALPDSMPENYLELFKAVSLMAVKGETQGPALHTYASDYNDRTVPEKGETSYCVSTNLFSAKESNSAIRSHRGVENINHHVKDAAMKEDFSRIRINPQKTA